MVALLAVTDSMEVPPGLIEAGFAVIETDALGNIEATFPPQPVNSAATRQMQMKLKDELLLNRKLRVDRKGPSLLVVKHESALCQFPHSFYEWMK
jgi:hypothetical protein